MATTLFEKVKELQAERMKQHESMVDYMSKLDGYGQVGGAFGLALGKLLRGGKDDAAMLQAQREDAYAKRVLMESDPAVQDQLLQGAYALSSSLGQNLTEQISATRAAMVDATYKANEEARKQAEAKRAAAKFAIEQTPKFEMPDEKDIAATTAMVNSLDWEGMNYTQAPNQMQVFNMAGLMKGNMSPTQAWLQVMGQPPSDAPINDKYADVRAKTDKQMPTTDVANPKSLSDPTEY